MLGRGVFEPLCLTKEPLLVGDRAFVFIFAFVAPP